VKRNTQDGNSANDLLEKLRTSKSELAEKSDKCLRCLAGNLDKTEIEKFGGMFFWCQEEQDKL
jgi:hypothetical protein